MLNNNRIMPNSFYSEHLCGPLRRRLTGVKAIENTAVIDEIMIFLEHGDYFQFKTKAIKSQMEKVLTVRKPKAKRHTASTLSL